MIPGQRQLHAEFLEQIGEPIPEAGRFDDRAMRPGERGKVRPEALAVIRDALLFDALAAVVVRCDDAVAFVLIDTRVVHGAVLAVTKRRPRFLPGYDRRRITPAVPSTSTLWPS